MMKLRIAPGDVFRFGNSGDGWGYGRVLLSDILQYIVIFEPKFLDDPCPQDVVGSPILLSGWTMDARLQSGDWQIIGKLPLEQVHSFPEYKVEIEGKTWVTDVEGKPVRVATAKEAASLPYKSSNSPIAYEKAFRAHHGNLPWEERFEQLLVKK